MTDSSNIKTGQEQHLPVHEWLAIVMIIGLLLSLTLITLYSNNTSQVDTVGAPHYVIDQEIEVIVQGAVENPGSYQVKRGALIHDVIALAKPLPEANLKSIKQDRKVRKGQVITVKSSVKSPRKKRITKASKENSKKIISEEK